MAARVSVVGSSVKRVPAAPFTLEVDEAGGDDATAYVDALHVGGLRRSDVPGGAHGGNAAAAHEHCAVADYGVGRIQVSAVEE